MFSDLTGSITGGLSTLAQARGTRRAGRAQLKGLQEAEGYYGDDLEAQKGYWQPYKEFGDQGMSMLNEGLNSGYYDETYNEFDDGQYNLPEYLDPSMDFRMQQGQRAREASAAGAGGLFSGAHALGLEDYSQDLASTEYGKAFDRMRADRTDAYDRYKNSLSEFNRQRTDRWNRLSGVMNVGTGATTNLSNATTGYNTAMAGSKINQGNVRGQIAAANTAANFAPWTTGLNMLGSAGDYAAMAYGGAPMQLAGAGGYQQPTMQNLPKSYDLPYNGLRVG